MLRTIIGLCLASTAVACTDPAASPNASDASTADMIDAASKPQPPSDSGAALAGSLAPETAGASGRGDSSNAGGNAGSGSTAGTGGTAGSDSDTATVDNPRSCTNANFAQCPRAYCSGSAAVFPAPLTVTGTVEQGNGTGAEPIESLHWRLSNSPSGSKLSVTTSEARTFSFVPDVAGDYTWCLTASTTTFDSRESCCQYWAPSDFSYSVNGGSGDITLDDLEVNCGEVAFDITCNQPTTTLPPTFSTSKSSLQLRATGSSTNGYGLYISPSLQRVENGALTYGDPQIGDHFGISIGLIPMLIGAPVTATDSVTIRSSVPHLGPILDDVKFNVFAGSGTVRVHTTANGTPTSPAMDFIKIGGWAFFSYATTSVMDDGKSPDEVAGDGWYTGQLRWGLDLAVVEPCNPNSSPPPIDDDGGVQDGGPTCTNPNAGRVVGQALTAAGVYPVLVQAYRQAAAGVPLRTSLEVK